MSRTLIFAIIFSFILVIFALQNVDVVDVDLYFWHYQSSLAIVVLVSFGIGALVGILFSVPGYLRRSRELRELKKRLLEQSNRPSAENTTRPPKSTQVTSSQDPEPGSKGMGSY